ncbi:MAG: hypothetical protein IH587_11380, partial [Anaerolineae bacterium]|nr:hypothetical protein [Anaerolineae bacterium]
MAKSTGRPRRIRCRRKLRSGCIMIEERPLFIPEQNIVLEHNADIDPEKLEDYSKLEGFAALNHVLTEMTPPEVIDQLSRSGLRGRGGAGYPTGLKWQTVAKAPGAPKYIICNGDEGDPGAFM